LSAELKGVLNIVIACQHGGEPGISVILNERPVWSNHRMRMDETYAAFDAKSNSKMDLANSEKEWRPLPDRVKPFYTSMQWCKHVSSDGGP
jgi:hypothetical protein